MAEELTKQEEIREWLGRNFCLTMGYLDYNTSVGKRLGNQFADNILKYEASRGVMIKVERDEEDMGTYETPLIPGYFEFEPLIEEQDGESQVAAA